MADKGIVARLFARVLPECRTPFVAILFTTLIAVVLITTGDLSTLADTTVLLLLLFVFTIVNIAVLVLRRERVEHEHFTAPSMFPVLGAVASVALILDTALDDLSTFAHAGGLVALAAVLWLVNRLVEGPHDEVEAERLRG
jgi:basic amino acid/polyamine antiporter, APA family